MCDKRTMSPAGLFHIWYPVARVSHDPQVPDGRCSILRTFAYIWDMFKQFPDSQSNFLIFSWTDLVFQPFWFHPNYCTFLWKDQREIILVLSTPFSEQAISWRLLLIASFSKNIYIFPFSKNNSPDNQFKILPLTVRVKDCCILAFLSLAF